MVDWHIKATQMGNCNCDHACPCQFDSLPNHGYCEATVGLHITEGHYGDVDLAGCTVVGIYQWPGPVHEGDGHMQAIMDPSTVNEAQKAALECILTGGDTEEFATVFWIFSAMSPNKHPTIMAPIEFEVDIEARRGRIFVEGMVDTIGEPITNPVTGDEHRVRIHIPEGFEYTVADIGSASSKTRTAISMDLEGTYGQFAYLNMTGKGPIHEPMNQ